MKNTFGSIILLFATFATAIGQQKPEIVTDRPDQTEASTLVPKGGLQIETGFVYEKDVNESITTKNITYATSLFKYGVNDYFELRLITEFLGSETQVDKETASVQGFGPLAVGVKIKLADEKGFWPQAALIGHLNLKSGAAQFEPEYTAGDFRFTLAHTLSDRLSLSYNIGAEWDGESPAAAFLYTLSLGYPVTERVGAYIECYSFFPEEGKADNRFDGGLTFKFSPVVQWDISGGIGLSKNAPDYFLSTGLSARLFK